MDTSFLTSLNLKTVRRDRLWFSKFQYCIEFGLDHAHYLSGLSRDRITRFLRYRERWINYGGNWGSNKNIPVNREKLYSVCDFINSRTKPYAFIASNRVGSFYTNNVDDLKAFIEQESEFNFLRFKQVHAIGTDTTLTLKNPKHKYRSYFKYIHFDKQTKDALKSYLEAQENIRFSPSLSRFFQTDSVWCREGFFIDYDDEKSTSMLGIIVPGLLRKTFNIVKDK